MRFLRSGLSRSLESGFSLIETIAALFILSTVGVTFLTGLAVTSRAAFTIDEQATAESLARTQMEWVLNTGYAANATYSPAPILSGPDYTGYSVNITAAQINTNIQKVTVNVSRSEMPVFTLESYIVNR